MLVTVLDKGFKIVLDTAVIIGRLRIPGAIDSGRKGHDLSPSRISCHHNVERSYYLLRRKSDAGSKTKTLNRKDAVLFTLVARYRQDNRHRDIAPLFIVLLRIEDSSRFAAESFKRSSSFSLTSSVE
jgi:hypothetical protein